MTGRGRWLGVVLGVVLGVTGAPAAAGTQSWADAAVTAMVEAMLRSLPRDTRVTYDRLHTDTRARTFEVAGLQVRREGGDMVGSGKLERLRASGVDVLAALSGKPFTAERIELTRLRVSETPRDRKKNRTKGGTYAANAILIEEARVPSFIAMAQSGGSPEQPLPGLTFARATIDGVAVQDVPQALARLRRRR
ncbi:MAG: hypothetical protein H7840_00230 [Alphaproteobacteria bacterium]